MMKYPELCREKLTIQLSVGASGVAEFETKF